ncbi:MAG: OsmC family protein [Puia sp.]|nr:OsmC family protein [Puia sp.]
MTDIRHKMTKSNRQYLFEVDLNWLSEQKGILSSDETAGTIQVAAPAAFGGQGREWSPEHLFLGAISSCFMSTYLSFAEKSGLELSRLTCNAIGQIEVVEGKYRFTDINLFPKIYVAFDESKERAGEVLRKTQQFCLVANSVNARMIYHPEVLKDPHPRLLPNDENNYKEESNHKDESNYKDYAEQ